LQVAVALTAALGASLVCGLTDFGMAILPMPALALPLVEAVLEAVVLANALLLTIGAGELRW
jgi:hypothetical protein